MANLDRIANVQIHLNTTEISREGFSTGIIVGTHSHTLNRVMTYTSIDAMESDGFTTADSLYQAANDYFAQTPRPREVKIGKFKCDSVIEVAEVLPLGNYTILIQTKDADKGTIEKEYTFKNTNLTAADILENLDFLDDTRYFADLDAAKKLDCDLLLKSKQASAIKCYKKLNLVAAL